MSRVIIQNQLPTRQELFDHLGSRPEKFLFVVDRKIRSAALKTWLKNFSATYYVKAGEDLKDLGKFASHVKAMMKTLGPASPHSLAVVAVGGGTIGDFAGFFAGVFKRGVPLIQMPTTFLAAVDSAHGGKNGLNVGGIKNQIGTFHMPKVVYVVESLLKDLPREQCHASLGEFAKMALLSGQDLWLRLKAIHEWNYSSLMDLLPDTIAAKNKIVDRDPFEQSGERQLLNLGHTMGHVIEAHYGLAHGEAVAMGLVFATQWSQHRGYLTPQLEAEILETLQRQFRIPTVDQFLSKHRRMRSEKLKQILNEDKKLIDQRQVRFVFLEGIGRAKRVAVPIESLMTEAERQGWILR